MDPRKSEHTEIKARDGKSNTDDATIVLMRSFGLFENWAVSFTTMNFVSGMPVLFDFAPITGGPQAIIYPEATVITAEWFGWCLSDFAIIIGLIRNIISQYTVRWMLGLCAYNCAFLLGIYWIWFSIAASRRGGFQSTVIFTRFYNGINLDVDADGRTIVQASDGYRWVIGVLFGAWEFYGYDASVHLAEETKEASSVVARGMRTGTACTQLMSIPTLALVLLYIRKHGSAGETQGAVAILLIIWFYGLLCTGICLLSAQRITYAIARHGVLPFSSTFSKLGTNHLPVNAAFTIALLSIAINAAVIG
ncbi:hypothetical protein MBLNU13_g03857t2 [Cladosporium sp. NU13]